MLCRFRGVTAFSGGLSKWDVSSVTDVRCMFDSAASFNGDLNTWNVSSVTNMVGMFHGATAFNGDLSAWNVSSAKSMGRPECVGRVEREGHELHVHERHLVQRRPECVERVERGEHARHVRRLELHGARVSLVDEFRTSQTCSCCGSRLQGVFAPLHPKRGGVSESPGRRGIVHAVKRCGKCARVAADGARHARYVHRDANARNIARVYVALATCRKRPAPFGRGDTAGA